jgi:transcriptional regulator with XRE-family HTH domain
MSAQSKLIREAMARKNVSAQDLADATGRTRNFIYRVTRGAVLATSEDLIHKLATALDLSTDDLYITANRLPPDVIETIIEYPAFIRVVRTNREKMRRPDQPVSPGP